MSIIPTLIFRLRSGLCYYFRASTLYNIQSPYFTKFIASVLDTSKQYYFYLDIEEERKSLLKNGKKINEIDYGAGRSLSVSAKQIKIRDIARRSLSSPNQSRLLANLVQFMKPETILELGTSLGISTLYMAKSSPSSSVWTLEGNPEIAAFANQLFENTGTVNIQVIQGPFETTLSEVLIKMKKADLIYLDGNHRKEPTLNYFDKILEKTSTSSIIVIDDIRWSAEMNEAWNMLKKHKKVKASLELWKIGILFFDPALSKENHVIIPYCLKPWRIGLFGN